MKKDELLTPLPEKIKKKIKKNAFYVDNAVFIKNLQAYMVNKDLKAYEEVGKTFILIAEGLLFKGSFSSYTPNFKADMKSDALYAMIRYMGSFDFTRENVNPFAYFTTICFNSYRAWLNKYKKDASIMIPISYIEGLGRESEQQ